MKINNSRPIILFICASHRLGDHIVETPMLRAMRARFPESKMAILTSKQGGRFFRGNPYGMQVLDKTNPCYSDSVYDNDSWDFAVEGVDCEIETFSFVTRHPNVELIAPDKEALNGSRRYIGLEYLRGLKCFGIDYKKADPKPEVWSGKDDGQRVSEHLSGNGFREGDFLLGVNFFGKTTEYPPGKFSEMILQFKRNWPFKSNPIKFFALYRADMAREYKNLFSAAEMADIGIIPSFNMSIGQLAEAVKKCSWLVSPDTGTAHVAQAVGTPATVIYRRSDVEKLWKCPAPFARVIPLQCVDDRPYHDVIMPGPQEVYDKTMAAITKQNKI